MDVVIYGRVSTEEQDYFRQVKTLREKAAEQGWNVRREFTEKITGVSEASQRPEFRRLLGYINERNIKIILVTEISRLGRRVIDILNTVETLHKQGVAIYIPNLGQRSIVDGKENPYFMLLIQMLSMGAELEHTIRKERQVQGIQIAKIRGKYTGRKRGAKTPPEKLLQKHDDVVQLIRKSSMSLREISRYTKKSLNTVLKLHKILQL